jgi:hypothetical protein
MLPGYKGVDDGLSCRLDEVIYNSAVFYTNFVAKLGPTTQFVCIPHVQYRLAKCKNSAVDYTVSEFCLLVESLPFRTRDRHGF